jgi:TonB family protein
MKRVLVYIILFFTMILFFSCKEDKESSVPENVFWNPELVDKKPAMLTSENEFIKGLNRSLTPEIINASFGTGNHEFTFDLDINKEGKFSSLSLANHIGSDAGIHLNNFLGLNRFTDYLKTVQFSSAEKAGEKVGSIISIRLSITLNSEGKVITPWQLTSKYQDLKYVKEPSVNKSIEKEAYTYVEQMPEYIGGVEALLKFISSNVKYPADAKQNGVEGKVLVQFIVDEQGKVVYPKIIKGVGFGCDEEAIRVVNLLKGWKPGMQGGKPVKVKMVIPFVFKLG